MSSFGDTTQIASVLQRLRDGDERARNELLARTQVRLRVLAEKVCRDFPGLSPDEALSGANYRLFRALPTVHPDSVVGFMRWAAIQMRRELIEIVRGRREKHLVDDPKYSTAGPVGQVLAAEFHELIAKMNDEDRLLFDLLYYGDLTIAEVAELLGWAEGTVRKRWNRAKSRLHRVLNR